MIGFIRKRREPNIINLERAAIYAVVRYAKYAGLRAALALTYGLNQALSDPESDIRKTIEEVQQ